MAKYIKIKSNNKFRYWTGSSVQTTTDEAECCPYDFGDKNDRVIIDHIIHNQLMIGQAVELIPVKEEEHA